MNVIKKTNRVYFRIYHFDDDPDEVTNMLGLTPDRTFRKGEIIKGRVAPRTFNFWSYQLEVDESIEVEEQIDILVRRLKFIEDRLAKLKETNKEITYVLGASVHANYYHYGIHLKVQAIRLISELNLELDFDLYFEEMLDNDS